MTQCENCSGAPATLSVTHIQDGLITSVMLCSTCASLPFGSHPGSLLAQMIEPSQSAGALACPRCGLDYAEFVQTLLLGCAACYGAFAVRVEPMIEKIHFAREHVGKSPATDPSGD